jgi:hypothetical protein
MILRSFHIIIALTLLLSTSGVTVTAYFCKDNLSGLSLLAPKECSSTTKACCAKAEDKKKCCTSDSKFFKIDLDQQLAKIFDYTDVDLDEPIALVTHIDLEEPVAEKVNNLVLYRPPPLVEDLTTLFQVYLC